MPVVLSKERTYNSALKAVEKEIHEPLKQKYLNPPLNEEVNNAKNLENFLRELKSYIYNKKHSNIQNTLISSLVSALPSELQTSLFNTSKGIISNDIGVIFEEQLAEVIFTIMKQISEDAETIQRTQTRSQDKKRISKVYTGKDALMVGAASVKTGTALTADEVKKIIDGQIQKLSLETRKELGNQLSNNEYFELKPVQGKSDLDVSFKITLKDKHKSELEELYKLFSYGGITAKSYSRKGTSKVLVVGLGTTSLYRIYMALLIDIGRTNLAQKHTIYYSSTNPKASNQNQIKEHQEHMRFLYELIGPGQIYLDNLNLKEVKYLIVNNNQTDEISVFSTKALIYDQVGLQNNPIYYKNVSKKFEVEGEKVKTKIIIS